MSKIYIDTPTNGWSHMVSDDLDALHAFAQSLGIKRERFQNKKKKSKKQPHYDVRTILYDKALEMGAIPVTRGELLTFLQKTFYPL